MALSALRASGLDAVLLDTDALAGAWREPFGQGGYRIAAASEDAPAARALLADAQAGPPPRPAFTTTAPPADILTPLRLILVAVLFLAIVAAVLWRGLW